MTNTELLLEAVMYTYDSDEKWWEAFDSKNEGLKILSKAIKEEADEHQIAEMLSCREEYIENSLTAEENYMYILKKLRKELQQVED